MYYPIRSVAHGIMFHHFHGRGSVDHPVGQGSIDEDILRRMIGFLGRERILNPPEFSARLKAGKLQPTDLVLTFDDALLCQYELAAPVLDALGICGFFFVHSAPFEGEIIKLEIYRLFRSRYYASFEEFFDAFARTMGNAGKISLNDAKSKMPLDYLSKHPFYSYEDRLFRFIRDNLLDHEEYQTIMDSMVADKCALADLSRSLWMTNEHLRDLTQRGHEVGMHSYSHPTMLNRLSRELQAEEYARNSHHLRSTIGKPPSSMSHPCNSYNEDTLQILRRMNLEIGFRADMDNLSASSSFEIPRQDHANVLKMMTGCS